MRSNSMVRPPAALSSVFSYYSIDYSIEAGSHQPVRPV
ncbi:hypothetical protein BACCAP_04115 [Pseudoflavonifractor capillosus ATCC 29799]|uniref:Uncharacterized protein n=1 Tax=Pseudoflavonifractor capillosus ATCC 29799 TaxID=411467 RepID=A6P0U8_9FIRM|nr:hypothetical protein BACCAP_04115 [Pseudoflavonifractor capillosus ATCC 29799]